MDLLLIGLVGFLASGLTLYSGFGLGTLLLPAFALFLPVDLAVAAMAVVHLLNNLFKTILLGRQADLRTMLAFGLPAIPAAVAGAWLLGLLGDTSVLFQWRAFDQSFGPTAAGLVVGILMIGFAVLELPPGFQRLSVPRRFMPLGGLITGFFGGLTGQQGALRSMFLLRSGLEPASFIATGVVIAVLVDLSRLPAYVASFDRTGLETGGRATGLIFVGTLSAFAGAYLGRRYVRKVTIGVVRAVVAALLLVMGAALASGVLGG